MSLNIRQWSMYVCVYMCMYVCILYMYVYIIFMKVSSLHGKLLMIQLPEISDKRQLAW